MNTQINSSNKAQNYLNDAYNNDVIEDIQTTEIVTPSEIASNYRLIREIGHGSQGHIYLAEDLINHRNVAIKQLKIGSVTNWKEYDLFKREAGVLKTLDMPGVAKCYDVQEFLDIEQPSAYIVQEYIEGPSLADYLSEGRYMPVNRIYDLLIQCLNILEKLHQHDPIVIHRDIKPANIMLKPAGDDKFEVYLIDFGAVANPQVQGGGSTIAGTLGYMPPEQLMGKPVPQSDIYSLAATAVHLFSHVSPADMNVKDFSLVFEPHMQSMPSALHYTLRAMLDPAAERRFCDYAELKSIFEQFRSGDYTIPIPIAAHGNHALKQETEESLHKKLENVKQLNEPGNIELWQALPLKTPRKVPKCYTRISESALTRLVSSILRKTNRFRDNESFFKTFCIAWALSFGLPFGTLAIGIYCLEHSKKKYSSGAEIFIALMFFGFGVILFSFIIGYFCCLFSHQFIAYIVLSLILGLISAVWLMKTPAFERLYTWREVEPKSGVGKNLIRILLRDGVKTIATITDISYVSQSDQILRHTSTNDLVCPGRPAFKIRYRFNPADDCNSDDLFHEIITRTLPEGHYAVGDPLPILYHVSRTKKKETVISVPFPFPCSENLRPDKIVGKSYFSLDG